MANIIKSNRPFDVDDLSTLLQIRNDHANLVNQVGRLVPEDIPRQQSLKGATLPDFIEMLSAIITKATRERNVIFEPDEGVRIRVDQTIPVDSPHIYYTVISRRPCLELKPRERQEVEEVDSKGKIRRGRIWGQRFECLLQFDIIAGNYKAADKVMEVFENVIFNYTSHFKENGVAEILFEEQITDHNFDIYRQSMSIRSLRYRVWIERLHTAFDTTEIDGIITD